MAIEEISVHDLKALDGNVVLFDVREHDEYVSGHVPGAINVPLSTLAENTDVFTGVNEAHVICLAGGRSMRACEFLSDSNDGARFTNIAGGTGAWIASGYEVVTGAEPI